MTSLNPFGIGKIIRFYFRLVGSYILVNRWYFFLGIVISFILLAFSPTLERLLVLGRFPIIGLAGNYTISSLPPEVQNQISLGLTKLEADGQATGAAAVSWQATDSGKKVTFTLRTDLKWQDGQEFDSSQVNYNLKSVELDRPAKNQVSFIFKEPFAPLSVTLAQPLFKNGLVGLGDFVVEGVKFNGRFVSQINLRRRQRDAQLTYKFYSSNDNLITALKLGAITQAEGLRQITGFPEDSHYQTTQATAKNIVVTLFFNTQQAPLDEKQVRQALTYALPDEFAGMDRAYGPIPQGAWWYASDAIKRYPQNLASAGNILDKVASGSARRKLTIQTNKALEPIANQIASLWNQIGAVSKVQVTDVLADNYDVYLGYLELPADPDQYALWHSTQQGNISHYKSPKIDKLLEEGRRTLNIADRLDIYSNFQKAITEEVPATFLFYPKVYTISRKF